ncbi:SDR family oxidoreductase [Alphaproteobacteria bacterium]|nr:SDR family oxidoreductase [Alphaproteobacteria bacterium]
MSVLLVTGSSRGIGAGICKEAARRGWKVCVNYAQSKEEALAVVSDIKRAGGTAISVQADVSQEDEVVELYKQIDKDLGLLTGLVNNVGTNGGGTRVDEQSLEALKKLFEVNVYSYFLCSKYALQRMAKRHGGQGGAIVNISSAASKHGGPFTYIDYAASKGAIDTFSIGLAKEQADEGVRVNCLRPGATMTELSTLYAQENPEWIDWVMSQVPLKRPAEVEEIARSALFLLSDEASYVTGAILDANGGWVSP